MKNKLLFVLGVFFSIAFCFGAVEFGAPIWNTGGTYGEFGNAKTHVKKIFDNRLIPAGTTVSSDWISLKKFTHFGLLSSVRDDVGTSTEAVTLTYNLSTEPGVNQSGTFTVYNTLGTDTNGNWRDDPITLTVVPYIQYHALAGVSNVYFDLHQTRLDD